MPNNDTYQNTKFPLSGETPKTVIQGGKYIKVKRETAYGTVQDEQVIKLDGTHGAYTFNMNKVDPSSAKDKRGIIMEFEFHSIPKSAPYGLIQTVRCVQRKGSKVEIVKQVNKMEEDRRREPLPGNMTEDMFMWTSWTDYHSQIGSSLPHNPVNGWYIDAAGHDNPTFGLLHPLDLDLEDLIDAGQPSDNNKCTLGYGAYAAKMRDEPQRTWYGYKKTYKDKVEYKCVEFYHHFEVVAMAYPFQIPQRYADDRRYEALFKERTNIPTFQPGTILGVLTWGYTVNYLGTIMLDHVTSWEKPSDSWITACQRWNTAKDIKIPAPVYA